MAESMGQNRERWSYDVFLSFRGEDVRDNFLSHLYKDLVRSGTNTFKDDDELERGENISPALLKAIENSKIARVVLSKNYASSSWCLDELVHIMKCSESDSRHVVLPVFYKVDPSDIRRQRGSFGEIFDKHNSRYPESKVQQWKDALTYVANLSGFHSLGCRDEAELIDNVIRKIIRILPSPYLHVPEYAVGIGSRIEHVKERMCFGSDDVEVIGIYGMGGIGKTTLAKAEAFSNLRKLRLLQLDYVLLVGSYTHFPEGLRWLYWHNFPLESSIPTDSYLKRLWDNAKVKSTSTLVILTSLQRPQTSRISPTKLIMEGCIRLYRVDKSIGTLHKLVLLNLKDCTNLEDLPLEPYALKTLEILVLSGCKRLERLDDALGTLTSLKDLYLDETGLQDLPSSIGYLKKLRRLYLNNTELQELPSSIGNLKKLRRLYLMGCTSLLEIPESINELISLKELDISWSSVKEIPLKSGSLPCLTDFWATGCLKQIPSSIGGLDSSPIETLPMEIGDLRFLLELDLTFCTSVKLLSENFGKLENLVLLRLTGCRRLSKLPESFGNLKSLDRLYMEDTSVAELPESFGNLSNLRKLIMSKRFFTFPGAYFSDSELYASRCRIWGKIPDGLEKLSSMRILNLGYNNFHSLPSSLEGLSNLRELSLYHCRELECVPPLPWKLEKLDLRDCLALKIISDLSKLEILHELDLRNCEKVADIPGLEHLTALEQLFLNGCNSSCSLAVKKRLSKVPMKRMREMSMPGNRIPDWFSQGPVTYSAQPNRELRSVILAVVVEYTWYSKMKIQAQILKLGEPLFSHSLDFYGLNRTNGDHN